jgi:hypothetical protein
MSSFMGISVVVPDAYDMWARIEGECDALSPTSGCDVPRAPRPQSPEPNLEDLYIIGNDLYVRKDQN